MKKLNFDSIEDSYFSFPEFRNKVSWLTQKNGIDYSIVSHCGSGLAYHTHPSQFLCCGVRFFIHLYDVS